MGISLNNRGVTIIQMMVFLGLASLVNVAMVQMILGQTKRQNSMYLKTSLMSIRQNLIGVVSSHHSWQSTRDKQNFMKCSDSQKPAFCFMTNPQGPKAELQL